MTTGWLVAFAVIGVLVAVASGILVARYQQTECAAQGREAFATTGRGMCKDPAMGALYAPRGQGTFTMPRRDTNTVRHSSIMLITLRGRCRLGNPGGR
jgi:hypothetical protein